MQRALLSEVDLRGREIALNFPRKVRQRLGDLEEQELFLFHPPVQRLVDDAARSANP